VYRILLFSLLAASLIGCGGTTASPPPAPSIPTAGGAPSTPSIVQVAAGQTASGVNIGVPAPAGTPANVQDLGVAGLTGPATAFNTGDSIHRGSTMRVVIFGPGLSPDMKVSILGPNDIQIASVLGIMATDTTPGISFIANVAANAVAGGRTVVLQSTNGNITTFTGGLEVVP
jgi:hypothetical protein